MPAVDVNIVDMGEAAALGGVRYDLPGGSVIVVHAGLSLDDQSLMLARFIRSGEVAVLLSTQPVEDRQRSTAAGRLRAAAVVASLTAIAACAAPTVTG